MKLALQAMYGCKRDASDESVRRRAQIEKDLKSDARSAEFLRKLRLVADDPTIKAPEIFADVSYPDPNIVASYLDGQIDSDLSREYEDACLESAMMLAEVGDSCDVLNNRLILPVEAPRFLRRRLYELENESDVALEVESDAVRAETNCVASSDALDSERPRAKKTLSEDASRSVAPKKNAKKNKKSAKSVARGSKAAIVAKLAIIGLAVVGASRFYARWRAVGTLNDSQAVESVANVDSEDAAPTNDDFDSSTRELEMTALHLQDDAPPRDSTASTHSESYYDGAAAIDVPSERFQRSIEIPDRNNDVFSDSLRY